MRIQRKRQFGSVIIQASIVLVSTTLIVACCVYVDHLSHVRAKSTTTTAPSMPQPPSMMSATPMILPAFQLPDLVAADVADLKDDAPVVGVCLGDEARAYSLQGMSGPSTHVVNDYFRSTPVTVAYCDVSDCARVFSSAEIDGPLNLRVAGWMGTQMGVALGSEFYLLDSAEIPLANLDFVRTTWGEWKQKFPATEVFIGGIDAEFRRVEIDGHEIDRLPNG